jgi:hypothetical protein
VTERLINWTTRRRFHWFVVLAVVAVDSVSAPQAAAQPAAASPIDGRWSSSLPLTQLHASGGLVS